MRIIGLHCREIDLYPSRTAYHRWGKGPKTPLRFSKSGEANLEAAYSTHWVKKKKPESVPNVDEHGEIKVQEGSIV